MLATLAPTMDPHPAGTPLALDASRLEEEVRRLRNENQMLEARVKCDVIQEDVLAKFQAALQPLHEGVVSGRYMEISQLEEDIAEVYLAHIQAFEERTHGLHEAAVASQRRDLEHGLVASLRRVAVSGSEAYLTKRLEDSTDEALAAAAVATNQPRLWPKLQRLWEEEADNAAERVCATLARLGCEAESATIQAKEADEFRAAARAAVGGRLDNPRIILPELLRRCFDAHFRYDPRGTLRVTGPFTDLESLFAAAMERVQLLLDEFAGPLSESLPPPETASAAPHEMVPLVDWRARDQFNRELRRYADDLFEGQATKQLLLRGSSDLPLWALLAMLFLGYDHILAALLQPLKLATLAGCAALLAATDWARRLGLLRGHWAAAVESTTTLATLGVLNSLRVRGFYAGLASRRGKAKGDKSGAPPVGDDDGERTRLLDDAGCGDRV